MTTFSIIRAATIVILASLLLYGTVYTADHTFFINLIIYLFIAVFSFFVYVIIIFKDRKEFTKTRNWISYLPTALGIVLISALLATEYLLTSRDSSPTILFASTPSDFNGI